MKIKCESALIQFVTKYQFWIFLYLIALFNGIYESIGTHHAPFLHSITFLLCIKNMAYSFSIHIIFVSLRSFIKSLSAIKPNNFWV